MTDKNKVEFIESYIKIGNGDYQWNDNHGELIRCKDCNFKQKSTVDGRWWCNRLEKFCDNDWFCADGESH